MADAKTEEMFAFLYNELYKHGREYPPPEHLQGTLSWEDIVLCAVEELLEETNYAKLIYSKKDDEVEFVKKIRRCLKVSRYHAIAKLKGVNPKKMSRMNKVYMTCENYGIPMVPENAYKVAFLINDMKIYSIPYVKSLIIEEMMANVVSKSKPFDETRPEM